MATFSQLSGIALSGLFQNRVRYALEVAAVNVYAEDPATAGHAVRAAFATRVANGTYSLPDISFVVLTNSTIAAEANPTTQPDNAIPDSDIQFSVNSIWNLIAGV